MSRHQTARESFVDLWWPRQNEIYPVRADSVPFSGNDPQPIRSITPSRFPLSFDVNRYFKPLWKPSHLLDTNLKSCGNCLRPTAQIFLRAKPTRAFMNNQEPDLNPTPAETDSAKTNESVQRERSELPVDQRASYLRSRQIALKKFSPQGGDPS
jgi:hypothetical protein